MIVFFDLEVNRDNCITDIGAISDRGATIHCGRKSQLASFISGADFLCGHNIFRHDLLYIDDCLKNLSRPIQYIDTLPLSALLFPASPYHHLLKNDKLQTEELNNPLNDSIKARDLFFDEVSAFNALPKAMQKIYYALLGREDSFKGFFGYVGSMEIVDVVNEIKLHFSGKICENVNIELLTKNYPIELAYCLALINVNSRYSIIPHWLNYCYPRVNLVMKILRDIPCEANCEYCKTHLDAKVQLKHYFGFDEFRKYNGEPLQEDAVRAAVKGKSLLAVLPTGGGKSLTFQLPALMAGETEKGLTVVISPLQSLMKDQVDNLEKKGIVEAATINGLLDPISRMDAVKRVEEGRVSILYISPESLRSSTIQHILESRNVVRFVIDEAHCFSAWGQDFRVDYMYIGDFIKKLQEKTGNVRTIPVSCFTATAKQKVISDIIEYFREKLGINLELFTTNAERTNLRYHIIYKESEEDKYITLRSLLIEKKCPSIVYVSRTKAAIKLAERLSIDGLPALPYYGKLDSAEKTKNQNSFMNGETDIIVATSAFGMGVDKDNVGLVIHYQVSGSLEDYIQEAGRAGRNQSIDAECYVLFNDNDLDEHFLLLNQTKLSINEIQQVWKVIKEFSSKSQVFAKTPLEIARGAGWYQNIQDAETKAKTALYALENAGYILRERNVPSIYADSILVSNMGEGRSRIDASSKMDAEEKEKAAYVLSHIISRKTTQSADIGKPDARLDCIADTIGYDLREVSQIVNKLKEENLLGDEKDISAFIDPQINVNKAESVLNAYAEIEQFLIDTVHAPAAMYFKELSKKANEKNIDLSKSQNRLRTIFAFWKKKGWLGGEFDKDKFYIEEFKESFEARLRELNKRISICRFVIERIYSMPEEEKVEGCVKFSVLGIVKEYNEYPELFKESATAEDVENALLFLNSIDSLKLNGGFLVIYNAISIRRLVTDNKIRYKKDDYHNLETFYKQKIQQVHIVGEFCHIMARNYEMALAFVRDYFQMDYMLFLRKYFKGERTGDIDYNITPQKYNKLFGELSGPQRKIIDDAASQYIVVAAGPGSGKTKVLVHKLASLLLLEDIKTDDLLMLTFSRAAATEFKNRLVKLIGDAAYFVEIKTFHSYAFDLLGKVGSIEESTDIVKRASELISEGNVDPGRITKSVLVIDEAQDMDSDEFALVKALMKQNEDMRVIAVGDDDQNIYEFRGSDSEHMHSLIMLYGAKIYELTDNYRSDKAIIGFANAFSKSIQRRMKTSDIIPVSKENGVCIVTKHSSKSIETPVIESLKHYYKEGTACILSATNNQALRFLGELNKCGYNTQLIQSTDNISLLNLLEVRTFLKWFGDPVEMPVIPQDTWNNNVERFKNQFRESSALNVCLCMLNSYAASTNIKYMTDLYEFISESKYEDFQKESDGRIYVSTIHKSKGHEFDQVYMMLDNFTINGDAERHALYVGMTRAKRQLHIHYNNSIFDGYHVAGVSARSDMKIYQEPKDARLQLSYRDVYLDYFKDKQSTIMRLHSGSELVLEGNGMYSFNGKYKSKVLQFSKRGMDTVKRFLEQGFVFTYAEVRFIVYWKGKDDIGKEESLIVLPDIHFEKKTNNQEVLL